LNESEGVRWHPRSTIEKYSADQVRWFRRVYQEPVTGWRLRAAFRSPEGGVLRDEGNGVVAGGLLNLARVLAGDSQGLALAPGKMTFGVGSDGGTEFSREHVHLANAGGEGPGRSFYVPMDLGYPQVAGLSTIEGQATFTEDMACFPWHEWCWAAGVITPDLHHVLRQAYRGQGHVMMNRKVHPAGYGVKEPGVAWVFRTRVELS
jgi:hypothetical protein